MTTHNINTQYIKKTTKQHMLHVKSILSALIVALGLMSTHSAQAINLAQSPLITLKTAPGLVMLTMGRDLPLYKAAYNDVNDIDGDNLPDLFFKPAFKYEGYFAYDRCYTYSGSVFSPDSYGTKIVVAATDSSKDYYKCPGKWSGNFLNWVTMARIDVLRKVLYGGKRSTDNTTTILERTYVPQDSTMWGKEYLSVANDGYNISEYTPLALPSGSVSGVPNRHMFANTTLLGANPTDLTAATNRYLAPINNPLMIVYVNRLGRIWDLVAQERPILGANPGVSIPTTDPIEDAYRGTITQYIARVATCVPLSGKYETNCTGYPKAAPTTYKPTGLLHKYGETKQLAFGLISGTNENNYAGGVLRQNIDDFNQEVNPANGQFITTVKGVVYHMSAFRPWGFGDTSYNWDGSTFASLASNGQFGAWGNPLGEMMFETLNYFSGGSASAAFTNNLGAGTKSPEAVLGLKSPAWTNPYQASSARTNTAAYPKCARPIQMTVGDPKTSFDSDHLPGSAFSVLGGEGQNSVPSLGTLNVSTEAKAIWSNEFGVSTKKFFVGEVLGNTDGNPTAKSLTGGDTSGFFNIRGHAPDSTTNKGSFYGASVSRFGKYTGVINNAVSSTQALRVDQISIALDSHIPQIKIPMANGKIITIVPISKSVFGSTGTPISNAKGDYQQTGAITAFFIDKLANTDNTNTDASINGGLPYYKFRISFSDSDQGNDNESDAKVTYIIQVTNAAKTQLSIGMEFFNISTFVEMHMGYVIGGTDQDGLYLDVGGASGGPSAAQIGYFLDTMPTKTPGSAEIGASGPAFTNITSRLPLTTLAAPRTFTPGSSASGEFIPHDMLWYAAKYGGASYDGTTATPKITPKLRADGVTPDSYYLVNNPSNLAAQMGQAFQNAAALSNATSTAAVSSGAKVSGGSLVYQAAFDTTNWGGDVRAFAAKLDGSIADTPTWLLSQKQPLPAARNVVLGLATSANPAAKTSSFNASSYTSLGATAGIFGNESTFKYLLGDRTNEFGGAGTGLLRKRTSAVGDFINSDPLYISQFNFGYSGTDYASFRAASKPNLIAIGSNDGFYRLIAADTGVEQLAFIPKTIAADMPKLADPAYTHQYYVDGPSAFGHVKFSTTKWNAVVASSLGAGGKAVFALNASATNLATSSDAVLWEFLGAGSGDGAYLGNVLNKPIVAQLNSSASEPAVLIGNGTNSANDKATLIVLNAENGSVIRTCTPTDAANISGNGMTSIAQVSYAEDGKVDLVYAGDYYGNIWRINPKVNSCGADAVKVFTAKKGTVVQPITAELSVKKAPSSKSGYLVLFGTGQFSTTADPSNKEVQSLYGVWDENVTSPTAGTINATAADLVKYSFGTYVAATNTRGSTAQGDTSVNSGKTWLETTGKKGWMIDLSCNGCATGERFLDKPLINGAITYYLSHIPSDDLCQPSGNGWVTALDTNTGLFSKGFKDSSTSNSAFVEGAAPRGLFILTTAGNGTTPSNEYLDLSFNNSGNNSNPNPGSNGSSSSIFGAGGGKYKPPGSNDETGLTQVNITQPPFSSRQVWRQIQ